MDHAPRRKSLGVGSSRMTSWMGSIGTVPPKSFGFVLTAVVGNPRGQLHMYIRQ